MKPKSVKVTLAVIALVIVAVIGALFVVKSIADNKEDCSTTASVVTSEVREPC